MSKTKSFIVISGHCLIAFFLVIAVSGCGFFIKTIPKGEIQGRTPEDKYIMIDNVNYHYREYPGTGRDIFLLHGFASSTYTWEKIIPYLTGQGYHVWALDMKGFGWSDKPEDAKYDAVTLMQEVNRWMDVIGLKDVVFVGNSLGGTIALLMALEYPDKTGQIVLIDSAGYPIKKPFIIRMAKIPFAGEITRLFFGRYVVESTLKEVLFNDDMVTEEKIDAYFRRMSTENAVYAQTALARSFDSDALRYFIGRIPGIKNRTLIIWGENDEWIPLESGYKFRKDLSNSTLVIFPECGHIPQEEKPESTAKTIIDFIENRPIKDAVIIK
ncbi:MAG: alpha/beta hydrolase [Proteobacteria bacterium]|nr:alpha/beta hydrolase [Pseudomonadota bacterium]